MEDNQSAIAKNSKFHGRAKHIDICHHFIREKVINDGDIQLLYCPTGDMVADMLTKGLYQHQLKKLMDGASVKRLN